MDRIAKLQEYLLTSPNDPFLRHALALEHIKVGNDEEARMLFEGILKDDSTYVGSYYHLGKLLERNGEEQLAIIWYEKGMAAAKAAGDMHSYNELLASYEDLTF